MKKYFFVLLSFVALFACNKEKSERATVIKDCTGTYLRINGKDYHVCNIEKSGAYANGTAVTASYKLIPTCNSNEVVCMMLHESEGWIEILSIKE